jgi:hypothetical protein
MKRISLKLYIIILALFLAFFSMLLAFGSFNSFSGRLVLRDRLIFGHGIFTYPWPPERVTVLSDSSFLIKQSPVYLFLFSPQAYSNAKLSISSSGVDYSVGVLLTKNPDVYKYYYSSSTKEVLQIDLSEAYYDSRRYGLVLNSSSTDFQINSIFLKLWSEKK